MGSDRTYRLPSLTRPLVLTCLLLSACAEGPAQQLLPIPAQTVAVHETLRFSVGVDGELGERRVEMKLAETLPGFDRTASLVRTGSGADFRWTPLTSHVGQHEIIFELLDTDAEVLSEARALVTISPAADAAPIFLRPGAGGTFDLSGNPVVEFDVEVRDDDSSEVRIFTRTPLPVGAMLTTTGPKQARFSWRPSPEQTATQERFTIALAASDEQHDPTPHDYIIVLRAERRDTCDVGTPPLVRILSPAAESEVSAGPSIEVRVEVMDDIGIRDRPLVYYTTATPEQLTMPDLSTFEQLPTEQVGPGFVARLPDLGLEPGERSDVFLVASATDNDDPDGTACDNTTDTPVLRFVAVRAESAPPLMLDACQPCARSVDCASGICGASSMGGVCLGSCESECQRAASCGDRTTVEGGIVMACGDVAALCDDAPECVDRGTEPNDTRDQATPLGGTIMASICDDDIDVFAIGSAPNRLRVDVGFDPSAIDLDLRILDTTGAPISISASTTTEESATVCAVDATVYAEVTGNESSGDYTVTLVDTGESCCEDDSSEPNDSQGAASAISAGPFMGTICPNNGDYLAIDISEPTQIEVTLSLDHSMGDLDIELITPSGAQVANSRTVTNSEQLTHETTETGTYVLRVFGFRDAAGDYSGTLSLTSLGESCSGDASCERDEICDGSRCRSSTCTQATDCPMTTHTCPFPGPSAVASQCGASCTINSDCRSSHRCKRFPEGRFCARFGTGANGAACETFADCGGQRVCLDFPGGYCGRGLCERQADCESGTRCVAVAGTGNLCVRDCLADSDICRRSEGHDCEPVMDVEGNDRWVCLAL